MAVCVAFERGFLPLCLVSSSAGDFLYSGDNLLAVGGAPLALYGENDTLPKSSVPDLDFSRANGGGEHTLFFNTNASISLHLSLSFPVSCSCRKV